MNLDDILPKVTKPARYTGGELNSIKKDLNNVNLKIALAYPDTYEVAMSNLGLQILYHILNSVETVAAERVFAPWPDLEEALKKYNLPLFSLESKLPLAEFDLIGFSLYHELNYTNLLNMLQLADIPLKSKDRNETHPLIFAGGPGTFNPEPLAEFIDFFIIGDAEEVIIELVNCINVTNGPNRSNRPNLIKKLAKIPGIYVPALNQSKIEKQTVKDLNSTPYPTAPIVPLIEVIHDRGALEIMRGCPHACKFCQAGWTGKPIRKKEIELLKKQGEAILTNTGYEELSLVSLSSSDYPKIEELAHHFIKKFNQKKVSISVPSMRSNSFSMRLSREIQSVRTRGVTLAPEAGTQRLRDLIGKRISEEDILGAAQAAFEYGANQVKLYYLLGLPTETEADLAGILELSRKILQLGREIVPFERKRRLRITVSFSTFIPKPHTPFQREKMINIPEILEKQKFLKQNLRDRNIDLSWHQAEMSYLEGIFARGDRKLSQVLAAALKLGAKFDAWSEHFKFELWQQAFANCGIDPDEYLRERTAEEFLPWEFINAAPQNKI